MSREALSEIAQQHTMDYVTKMGEDQKQELRDILSEGLGEGKGMRDIAQDMENSVEGMKSTRARAIARTETTRAKNLGQWYKYKDKGFQSFTVDFTGEACDHCVEEFENKVFPIDAVEKLPPENTHPHCMCVAIFHQETAEEYADKYGFEVYDGGSGDEEPAETETLPMDEEEKQQLSEVLEKENQEIQDIIKTVKDLSGANLSEMLTVAIPEVTGSTEQILVSDLTESMHLYLKDPKNFIQEWPARAKVIIQLLKQMGLEL